MRVILYFVTGAVVDFLQDGIIPTTITRSAIQNDCFLSNIDMVLRSVYKVMICVAEKEI